MIHDNLMSRVISYIKEQIDHAKIVIDDKEQDAEILKAEIAPNYLLKVFVNTPRGSGVISDLRLYDKDGKLMISKPQEITKTTGYGLVSSFYIQLTEREITDPMSIFEMGGRRG